MNKSSILIAFGVLAFSCTAVRKSGSSKTSTVTRTDSSTTSSNYRRETTTVEKSEALVYLAGDSLETTGYLPIDDTCSNTQEIESNGMSISTTAVPRKDSTGKTTGFALKTKAKIKPRTVPVPIQKTSRIVETGEEKKQAATVDTYTKTESWWEKQVKRVPLGVQIATGAGLIILFVIGLFKFWKR